jgi:hypothetical protein
MSSELYLIQNTSTYAVADLRWELVGDHHWLRMQAIHLDTLDEIDVDLDVDKRDWDQIIGQMEQYRTSRGITFIFYVEKDRLGNPVQLEVERIIETPTIFTIPRIKKTTYSLMREKK